MGSILEKIEQALKDMLIGWIESNLTNMFTDVNEKVGTIAAEVGQTPSGWNGGVYQMIRGLSENVIVPIAGIIITFVLCYELISMITEKNNLHDMDNIVCHFLQFTVCRRKKRRKACLCLSVCRGRWPRVRLPVRSSVRWLPGKCRKNRCLPPR